MTATTPLSSIAESTTISHTSPADVGEAPVRLPIWNRIYAATLKRPGVAVTMGNTFALAAERIVKLGVALVITANLGKLFGPVDFGIYSTIAAVTTALAVTSDLGTSRIVVRELVRQSSPPEFLLGTAFFVRLLGGLLTGLISYVVSVMSITSNTHTVHIVAAFFVIGWLLRPFDVVDYGFQARSHCGYPVAVRSSVMCIMGGVQLWMMHSHFPLWTFALAFMVESLIASIGLLLMWNWQAIAPIRNWAVSRDLMRRLLSESWPMFAAAFLSTIYFKSDLLIVNRLCDAREAGLYASSARLYDMMVAPIPMFMVAVYPLLARWYDDPAVSFHQRYVILTRYITLSWMAVLAVIMIFSRQVLNFFYGASFVDASPFLSVSCLSALLMANGCLRSSYLNLASMQRILLWTSLISAIVNVCLNYVMVSLYGAIGASYGGVITQVIALTLLNLLWVDTRWLTLAHLGVVSPGLIRTSALNRSALSSPKELSNAR